MVKGSGNMQKVSKKGSEIIKFLAPKAPFGTPNPFRGEAQSVIVMGTVAFGCNAASSHLTWSVSGKIHGWISVLEVGEQILLRKVLRYSHLPMLT